MFLDPKTLADALESIGSTESILDLCPEFQSDDNWQEITGESKVEESGEFVEPIYTDSMAIGIRW